MDDGTQRPESRLTRPGVTLVYVLGFVIGWHLADWLEERAARR